MVFDFHFELDLHALSYGLIAISVIHNANVLKGLDITNLHLAHIANAARENIENRWPEFKEQIKEKNTEFKSKHLKQAPTMLSAMITHGKLFLCSSIKGSTEGGRAFALSLPEEEKNFLMDLLRAVDMVENDIPKHRNQANCGEVHAVHLWHRQFPDEAISAIKHRSIVTAAKLRNREGQVVYTVVDPCGTRPPPRPEKGCITLVESWNLFAVLQEPFQDFSTLVKTGEDSQAGEDAQLEKDAQSEKDLEAERDIAPYLIYLGRELPEYCSIIPGDP